MDCGTVKGFNPTIGRLAVLTDHGYVIADIQSGEARVGDEIHGAMDDHGDQEWRNATSDEDLEVYVEAFYAGPEAAGNLLRQQR